MGFQVFDEKTLIGACITINAASGTAFQQLVGAAPTGSLIERIVLTQNDAIDHMVEIQKYIGTNQYQYGSVNVPAGAGYNGVPPVDFVASMPASMQNGIYLVLNYYVRVRVTTAMQGATVLTACYTGGNF